MYKVEHQSCGLVSHGISTCAGCGMELVMRAVMEVVGEDTILIIPPGCAALFSGYGRESNVKVAGYQCNLENVAATASGVRAALDAQGNTHTTVLGFAGDGATIDIGIQALSGAIERRDRILYICYDNEAYMNTGIQGSGSTPVFASTTTTPSGKQTGRKDLLAIAIAHGIPYAASASVADLADLKAKVGKAKDTDGPSLLHVFTPCPTGWGYHPAKTIQLAKAAVKSGFWVVYEYNHGKTAVKYRQAKLDDIGTYLDLQGRFKRMSPERRELLQKRVENHYRYKLAWLDALGAMEGDRESV